MNQIKIIIADDHDLFRSGLTELLKKHSFINIVASVANGEDLLEELHKQQVDVVLLDLVMPKMNGFEVLEYLAKNNNETKVIVISMHDDGNYITKCAKHGAYGYLLKNADEEELLSAVKSVFEGKKYYGFEITEKLINNLTEESPSYKKLTNKETEILAYLAKGSTTKEIAKDLFVSTRTVETHRANLLKKLKVKNSVELVNKAFSLGII